MFDTTGADCALGQSGPVWFLAGVAGTFPAVRYCTVPADVSVFFPVVNVLNDYPCPDPSFQPAPKQSMQEFLTIGARQYNDPVTFLAAEIDGTPVQSLMSYRATSPLFKFTGDSSLAAGFDPCITGSRQDGVSDGYWLHLAALSPGQHTIHFTAKVGASTTQDVTYHLTIAGPRLH